MPLGYNDLRMTKKLNVSFSEDSEKQDKVEDRSNSKQHFRFDIPKWSHGETCKQGDSRFECKSCKVKVKLRSSLLPTKAVRVNCICLH